LHWALDFWKLWLPETKALFEYGRIAFALKAAGRPIGQNDIMIAAIALTLGQCTVVTMDSDLSNIPGLTIENWASPLAKSGS
jgi:tRNA(fMet)-specific endonuclease VapC